MKLFKKKGNNKGFSLVELIVVVAIMAVLLGVLVPTLIRHVESSKLGKDKQAIDNVKEAIEIALANEKYMSLETETGKDIELYNSGNIVLTDLSKIDGTVGDDFLDEVKANLGGKDTIKLTSKLTKKAGDKETTIKVTIKNCVCKIVVDAAAEDGADYNFTIGE